MKLPGGVEVERQPPGSPQILENAPATIMSSSSDGGNISRPTFVDPYKLIEDPDTRTFIFIALDGFFVWRTKLVLFSLNRKNTPVSKQEFETIGKSFGIPTDNIHVTWQALIDTRCVNLQVNDTIELSSFGKVYMNHLMSLYKP